MKTAISVPDAVFRRAEKLAKRTARSRSELYSRALEEFLDRHEDSKVAEQLNAVYQAQTSQLDSALKAQPARVLKSENW